MWLHLSRFFISLLTYHLEKEALTLLHRYQDSPQPVSISLCVAGRTDWVRDGPIDTKLNVRPPVDSAVLKKMWKPQLKCRTSLPPNGFSAFLNRGGEGKTVVVTVEQQDCKKYYCDYRLDCTVASFKGQSDAEILLWFWHFSLSGSARINNWK